jgi:hypothetical protein
MSGAIPLLPQYAFMAWCLVKTQGQLYLYLFCMATWRFFIMEEQGFEHLSSEECLLLFSPKSSVFPPHIKRPKD